MTVRRWLCGIAGAAVRLGACALHLNHHVILFDLHREGLGHIGPLHQFGACGDGGLELPDLEILRVAPGLAGADDELPAVPGAAQELALARDAVLARTARLREPDDAPFAHRPAGMRTSVRQREEFAADVENADLAAFDSDELLFARLQLISRGDDMAAHDKR